MLHILLCAVPPLPPRRYLIPDLLLVDVEVLESEVLPALQSCGVVAFPAAVLLGTGIPPVGSSGWMVLGSQADDVRRAWDALIRAAP